jgi:hypothetical protein
LADTAAYVNSSDTGLTFSFVDRSVKEKLEARDDAAAYKCVQV